MGRRHLVPRQGHAPPPGRLGRRRDRRHDAGAGAVARGLRRRQALSRSAPSSRCPAPAPSAARPRWSACRWRSTASTRTAASTAGRSSWSSPTTRAQPDVARRKTAKMVRRGQHRRPCRRLPVQHLPRLHAGLGGGQDRQHDQRVPRHHADHLASATATASASTITRRRKRSPSARCSTKMGKKWHIAYADYSWGQSTRDAYAAEIKKNGGEVVGTTGIPLGTADMTPFLSKISGNFDGLFGIFFGKDGVTIGNQAYDLGLTKKYKWAGDGAICRIDQPAGARQQDRRLHRHQPLHPGVRGRRSIRRTLHKLLRRGQEAAGQDRSVGPAARPLRAVELRSA